MLSLLSLSGLRLESKWAWLDSEATPSPQKVGWAEGVAVPPLLPARSPARPPPHERTREGSDRRLFLEEPELLLLKVAATVAETPLLPPPPLPLPPPPILPHIHPDFGSFSPEACNPRRTHIEVAPVGANVSPRACRYPRRSSSTPASTPASANRAAGIARSASAGGRKR